MSVGLSKNLTVSNNTFEDNGGSGTDENFIALFCTESAVIENNTLSITDLHDANAESPIYLGGGDVSPLVEDNTETGGGATDAAGVEFNTAFYANDNATVEGNIISGFNWGVLTYGGYGFGGSGTDSFAAPTGFTIENNTISDTDYGVQVLDDAFTYNSVENIPSGGTISDNSISASTVKDCFDASTGAATDGTGNNWSANTGASSSPTGLCGTNSITPGAPPTNAVVGGATYTPGATVTAERSQSELMEVHLDVIFIWASSTSPASGPVFWTSTFQAQEYMALLLRPSPSLWARE